MFTKLTSFSKCVLPGNTSFAFFKTLPWYDKIYTISVIPWWLAWTVYLLIGIPIL